MILRLDNRRLLVWRSPHSLQIGVDPRLAVLDDVTEGDARLVDALTAGITRSGLVTLAGQAGVPPHRVDEVLEAVAPALERQPSPGDERTGASRRPPVAVVGSGEAAGRVAGVLGEAGHPVAFGSSIVRVGGRRPAAAVLVSTHVADPLEHPRWLRRDIPHLPIVFGEVAVTIGPLVVPGLTACLTCIEGQRCTTDAAWSVLASQVWGRAAAAETLAVATEAAVEAIRLVRRPGDGVLGGLAVRLDIECGERTEMLWLPSEHCGCRGLSPSSARAPRRESGSVPAPRGPRSAVATTTARAPAALG